MSNLDWIFGHNEYWSRVNWGDLSAATRLQTYSLLTELFINSDNWEMLTRCVWYRNFFVAFTSKTFIFILSLWPLLRDRDKETGSGWQLWAAVIMVLCHSLMHSVSLLPHPLCNKPSQHTHTQRLHIYCALTLILSLSVLQCPPRSWFGRGTRSQLRVAP